MAGDILLLACAFQYLLAAMQSEPHLDSFLNVAGDFAGDLIYDVAHGPEIGGFQPGTEIYVGCLDLRFEARLIRLGLQIIDAAPGFEL